MKLEVTNCDLKFLTIIFTKINSNGKEGITSISSGTKNTQ